MSDFPEFQEAYIRALLPDNPDQFDLLAAHANFSLYHSDLWHGTAQRFALSIVQECIRLCDQVDLAGADDCINSIKDHFGIHQ